MILDDFLSMYETVPVSYYRWMLEIFEPQITSPVLEIGSGPGIITKLLLDAGQTVVGLDKDRETLARLKEVFAGEERLSLRRSDVVVDDLSLVPGAPFPTVFCLNVLEHIEDDVLALRNMRNAVAPQGRLCLLVPALPRLYGTLDREVGHLRRYRRCELETVLERAGFKARVRYFNMLGIPGWWWNFCLLRRRGFSPRLNRVYDRVLPVFRASEALWPPPFGLSLVAVGRKSQ